MYTQKEQFSTKAKTNVLLVFLSLGIILIIIANLKPIREQQFVYLADSFIKGKLYFMEEPSLSGWADTSIYKSNYYWPLGIFPTLLLMPWVALFGTGFSQGYLSIVLTLINVKLLYEISKKLTNNKLTSTFLTFAYIFGSAYFMTAFASFSWYFAHVVASCCLISALYFTLVKKQPFLAGCLFTCGFLTRISVSLGIIFFLAYYYYFDRKGLKNKLVSFGIPAVTGILAFLLYNYARFDNILETGYRYQILFTELVGNRKIGLWSLAHFPAHIQLLFFEGPTILYKEATRVMKEIEPNYWGMSFIYTSPVFLYLSRTRIKNKLNLIAITTATIIGLFLFGTFGLGAYQYGYRFALDFQPFLFLPLCNVFKERQIGWKHTIFIVASFFFNLFMISKYFTTVK